MRNIKEIEKRETLWTSLGQCTEDVSVIELVIEENFQNIISI